MYTGETPFANKSQMEVLKGIHSPQRVSLSALKNASPEFRLLIRQLLVKSPDQRLGYIGDATEVMQHPFFRDTDWDLISGR